MTLMELTEQESGIVVYDWTDKSVAVMNWCNAGDDMIPLLSPLGDQLIAWPQGDGVFDGATERWTDDVRKELPGSIWLTGKQKKDGSMVADTDMDVVYDELGDLLELFLGSNAPTAGTVYTLKDGRRIIAPDGWH